MRESSSDHKEAPVYLAVMSADPCEPGNPTQLPVNQTGPGKKSSSRSSNNDSVGEILRHPSSDLLDSRAQDENTKSAFEITSVSPFDAEDLELSMQHPKGMSGSFVEDQKLRGQSESSESDEKAKVPLTDFAKDTTVQEHISESNEKFVPLEGASNGPVVASVPRRFRLVNKYERGRWVIEDTSEPREMEERPESELKGAYTTNQNSKGNVANTLVGRDSPSSQRKRGEERVGDEVVQLHSRSNSDLGGQGLDTASTGERESHVDRSSVVGETASNLSRNTSLSSLTTAGDKSVDGDHSSDQLSQLKDESETEITYPATLTRAISTSAGTSAQPAVSSPPLQHRHGEATLPSTSINAANTSDSGGEESQHESQDKSAGVHRVQTALSHLNEELQRMLEENKEITRLKEEKRKLEDHNRELQTQNTSFRNKIADLGQQVDELTQRNEELNTRLQNCLTKSQTESGDS